MLHFGSSVLHSAGRGLDFYLTKLDADGALLWQRRVPSRQTSGIAVAAAPHGDVFLCNAHRFGVDPGGGASSCEAKPSLVLTKLDAEGETAFARRYPVDKPLGFEPSLAVDGEGAVLLASSLQGTIDFQGGALVRGNHEGANLLVAKFGGDDGEHRWSRCFPGASELLAVSVHGGENGSGRVVGFFGSTLDLGVGHLLRSAPEKMGLFVAKVAA